MKLNKIFTLGLLVIALVSCDDFGDMNINPNKPSNIDKNPELILTGICKDNVNRMVNDGWGEGNIMSQYAAKIVFTAFDQFEWGTQYGTWNSIYRSGREANNLITIADTTKNESYKAVAMIIKAWTFQILTDMWGDIPYSEALKGKTEEKFTPVYDSQKDVYTAILADLDEANTMLSKDPLSPIKGDIIFNGILSNWRMFANSLRLRALLRLSNVETSSGVDVDGEIAKMLNSPSTYPLILNNADNATMTYMSAFPNVHPKSEASGYRIGSYDEYRMSETIEKVLEAHNDPRQAAWFAPTEKSVEEGAPDYQGMINGMVDGNAYEYKGGPSNLSKINPEYFYYLPDKAKGILMLASEVHFIIAEAAVRYPAVAAIANAQEYYEKGIELNFEYWEVDMPADFLSRTSDDASYTVPVAYDGELETILTQKWLALFYTDYQGFCEYKRTGFPSIIKPGPDAQSDDYPSRFLYPDDEQSLNLTNHDNAVNAQAGSVGNYSFWTAVWWEGN